MPLVHQTYESANHVLASHLMSESQRSCKEYLLRKGGQHGRYIFWSANDRNALMKSDHQDIYEAWRTLPLAVMKVDLWRLAALYKHGGLYVDMDLVLNHNTPDLFSSNQLVCGTENAEHYCAWLLSAPRGSAAVFHILQHLKAKLKEVQPITASSFADDEHTVHSTTGPGALTSAIKSWLAVNGISSRQQLSPSGASYPGITVLPRAALRGGLAKHHFMGGKSNGWLEHRDRLVTEGKQIQEKQKHRDLERDRLEEVRLEEQKRRQEEEKQKEKERLERAQLEEQMQERARIEEERRQEEEKQKEKERLERAQLEEQMQERARIEEERRQEEEKQKEKERLERAQLEEQMQERERLERARTSNEIQTLKDNVIGHAEDVAKRTKNEIETALTLVAKEVCCNTEDAVRQLVRPLDLASATAIENEKALRKVDNKFPDGAGQDIITKLEEMHSAIGTIADKLEATQLRLESMERTRLLEAEGAVATGILDDEEFVLVYVGPSAVDTVTLAHIRECEEGEYEITPEMQVGASTEEKTVFTCNVTALDIIVTRRDGEEGWISDLRFFLPRPATGGVCKYLEDADDTIEEVVEAEDAARVEEQEADVAEAVTLEAFEGQAAVPEQAAGEEREAVGEETAVEEQEAMAVDEEKTKAEAAEEQEAVIAEQEEVVAEQEAVVEEQEVSVEEQEAAVEEHEVSAEERAAVEEQEASVDEQEAAVGELEGVGEQKAVEEHEAELEKEATVTEKDLVEGEAVVQGIVVGQEASEEPGAEALAEQSVAVAVQNAMEIEATDEMTARQDTPVKQEEVVKLEEGIRAEIATTEVVEDTKLSVENESTDISSVGQTETDQLNGSSSSPENKKKKKKKRRKKKGKR